jgi:hypothetical protein
MLPSGSIGSKEITGQAPALRISKAKYSPPPLPPNTNTPLRVYVPLFQKPSAASAESRHRLSGLTFNPTSPPLPKRSKSMYADGRPFTCDFNSWRISSVAPRGDNQVCALLFMMRNAQPEVRGTAASFLKLLSAPLPYLISVILIALEVLIKDFHKVLRDARTINISLHGRVYYGLVNHVHSVDQVCKNFTAAQNENVVCQCLQSRKCTFNRIEKQYVLVIRYTWPKSTLKFA